VVDLLNSDAFNRIITEHSKNELFVPSEGDNDGIVTIPFDFTLHLAKTMTIGSIQLCLTKKYKSKEAAAAGHGSFHPDWDDPTCFMAVYPSNDYYLIHELQSRDTNDDVTGLVPSTLETLDIIASDIASKNLGGTPVKRKLVLAFKREVTVLKRWRETVLNMILRVGALMSFFKLMDMIFHIIHE
jgi:hypothetical protein